MVILNEFVFFLFCLDMLLSRVILRSDLIFTKLAEVSLKPTTSNKDFYRIFQVGPLSLPELNVLGARGMLATATVMSGEVNALIKMGFSLNSACQGETSYSKILKPFRHDGSPC